MLAFRSLDPFRALREPDRRRLDEERLSRSEQRTLSKTQNNHLTGKAPYKFESGLLQRRVSCEPGFLRQGAENFCSAACGSALASSSSSCNSSWSSEEVDIIGLLRRAADQIVSGQCSCACRSERR